MPRLPVSISLSLSRSLSYTGFWSLTSYPRNNVDVCVSVCVCFVSCKYTINNLVTMSSPNRNMCSDQMDPYKIENAHASTNPRRKPTNTNVWCIWRAAPFHHLRHRTARQPRRSHLRQDAVQPLQRPVQMQLNPARCRRDRLAPDWACIGQRDGVTFGHTC